MLNVVYYHLLNLILKLLILSFFSVTTLVGRIKIEIKFHLSDTYQMSKHLCLHFITSLFYFNFLASIILILQHSDTFHSHTRM